MAANLRKWALSQKSVCSVPPEILECHDDDLINELNAVNDLYLTLIGLNATRLNMNLLLRISNATTTKMLIDVASDFIEPPV